MALKPNKSASYFEDNSYFTSGTAEAGQIAVLGTGGSGISMDNDSHYCYVATTVSGTKPVGAFLCDVVNKDLTQTHLNYYKNEVQTGGKANLIVYGDITTNQVIGTPAAEDPAYAGNSGKFTATYVNATATPPVGRFKTSKDADGYARIRVDVR